MKVYIICMLIGFSFGLSPGELGASCNVDTLCMSGCCSNNNDYETAGVCSEIVDVAYCRHRKKVEQYLLLAMSISVFGMLGVCYLVKRNQILAHKLYLKHLKEDQHRLSIRNEGVDVVVSRESIPIQEGIQTRTNTLLTTEESVALITK